MEALNGNIHNQIFCGIRINPANPPTNYKLIDDIILCSSACQAGARKDGGGSLNQYSLVNYRGVLYPDTGKNKKTARNRTDYMYNRQVQSEK